ncbi:EGF-like domain-containing protein [Cavenderia fasciculata]|uniref:EGF-like domain-containing protein n=1 Tax=Cavenderia fasciculata TaxID=261658 RepID=F4QF14_CACFS|nr:EGF-like domain-containing protein [Cavenderia fasciculata]EGG13373.1 EGF-like domain-containing protein [Cavenderia fasciculata]|eukprot:XP_004350077.1 EGF-like domain-containing protein [Cavenderia fasciculata]
MMFAALLMLMFMINDTNGELVVLRRYSLPEVGVANMTGQTECQVEYYVSLYSSLSRGINALSVEYLSNRTIAPSYPILASMIMSQPSNTSVQLFRFRVTYPLGTTNGLYINASTDLETTEIILPKLYCYKIPSTLTMKSSNITRYVEDATWVVEVLIDQDLDISGATITCSTLDVNSLQCTPVLPYPQSPSTDPIRLRVSLNPNMDGVQYAPNYSPLLSFSVVSTQAGSSNTYVLGVYGQLYTNPPPSKLVTLSVLNMYPQITPTVNVWEQYSSAIQIAVPYVGNTNNNQENYNLNNLEYFVNNKFLSVQMLQKVYSNDKYLTFYRPYVTPANQNVQNLLYQVTDTNSYSFFRQGGQTITPNVNVQGTYLSAPLASSGITPEFYFMVQMSVVMLNGTFLDSNLAVTAGTYSIDIPAPFGITTNNQTVLFKNSFIYPTGITNTFVTCAYKASVASKSFAAISPPPASSPVILNVRFLSFTGYSCLVQVDFETNSATGLQIIRVFDYVTMGVESIVRGNLTSGTAVTEINYNPTRLKTTTGGNNGVVVVDTSGASTIVNPGQFLNAIDDAVPSNLGILQLVLRPSDFTSIEFLPNNIDTSYGPTSVSMLFNLTQRYNTPDVIYNISIYLNQPSNAAVSLPLLPNGIISVLSYFDYRLWCNRVDFTLPQNLGNDTLYYFINQQSYSQTLFKVLGQSSQLKVKSNYLDKFPPMVLGFNLYTNQTGFVNSIITVQTNELVELGIEINISDLIVSDDNVRRGNGLDYGMISIGSDIDPIPRIFRLDQSTLIRGDMLEGTHRIKFTVNGSLCVSQTFAITKLYLVDRSGWSSSYPSSSKSNTLIDPFIRMSGIISYSFVQLACPDQQDVVPPTLTGVTVSPATINPFSKDRDISIIVNVADVGGPKFSLLPTATDHQPKVYLFNDRGKYVVLSPTTNALFPLGHGAGTYTYNTTLPYGFGGYSNLSISIHNVFDNSLNVASWSSADLKSLGYPFYIRTAGYPLDQQQWLELRYPVAPLARDGGSLMIVTSGPSLRDGADLVVKVDGLGLFNIMYTNPSLFAIQVNVKVPLTMTSVQVSLVSKSDTSIVRSTVLTVPVKDYVAPYTPPAVIPCPSSGCGGPSNGYCGDNGCDEPTVIIGTNNTDNLIYSIMSVYSIREIDTLTGTYQEYPLLKWTFTNNTNGNLTNSGLDSLNYQYTSNVSVPTDQTNTTFVNTTVTVTVQWFKNAQDIVFGNQLVSLPPSSTKINIGLSAYPFQSITNTLQVILDLSINIEGSDSDAACKGTELGLGNGDDQNDLQWIKLKAGESAVYARFIRSGIIDGRQSVIRNSVVEQSQSSGTRQFIGINVPYYTSDAQLDPDLSMLIDHDGDDYGCDNKPTLSKPQIAGIIVGGIVLILACSILLGWYIRKKYLIRISGGKIEMVTLGKSLN